MGGVVRWFQYFYWFWFFFSGSFNLIKVKWKEIYNSPCSFWCLTPHSVFYKELKVGLEDLGDLFQPFLFNDLTILWVAQSADPNHLQEHLWMLFWRTIKKGNLHSPRQSASIGGPKLLRSLPALLTLPIFLAAFPGASQGVRMPPGRVEGASTHPSAALGPVPPALGDLPCTASCLSWQHRQSRGCTDAVEEVSGLLSLIEKG